MRDFFTAGLRSPSRLAVPFLVAMAVASCGGGGGGGSSTKCLPYSTDVTCPTSGTGTQTATQLSLTVDTPTMQTDGSSVVTLTATLKDNSNAVVSGQTVNFATSSGTISAPSATTNANGVASITFNSNDNKTNRQVTVTATSGALTPKTTIIDVQGTHLGFGGDSSGVVTKPVSMTINLLDGSNKAVAYQPIQLSSALNNLGAGLSTVTTDASGQALISFVPTNSGIDTIKATALGTSLTQRLEVSAVDFTFSAPASGASVVVGVCQAVEVQLLGASTANAMFSTSRGKIYSSLAACTAGGSTTANVSASFGGTNKATAYVVSGSAGATTVTAQINAGAASTKLNMKFVAITPSSIVVQASPTVISVGGTASITAIVKDATNNPVAGQIVTFTAPIVGGVPNPATAVTNESGVASTSFVADSYISGKDSVQVVASVGALESTATLTVAGQSIAIDISTDSKLVISPDASPRYRMVWNAVVTDTAGAPVKNQTITLSVLSLFYGKGEYSVTNGKWEQSVAATCNAEDANNNGVIELGEVDDINRNGRYEPHGGVVVRSAVDGSGSITVTTDASGGAAFWVEYLRSEASWVAIELKATAAVAGKNSVAVRRFWLPVLADEITVTTASPSFQSSPYGLAGSCTDPN